MMQMMHLINIIGIYKITNTVNGKIYIGQSKNTRKRIMSHKRFLRKGVHSNSYLQWSYSKHGSRVFEYEILENCKEEELNLRECYWINYYNSHVREYGYNIALPSKDGASFSHSEETKKLITGRRLMYSNEELISYLQEFFYMEGKIPTVRDIGNNELNGYPKSIHYRRRFGSLKKALIAANLYDYVENKKMFDREIVTRDDIIENYSMFVEKHNRFPTGVERSKTAESGLYSTSMIIKLFKDTQELKDILGYTREFEIKKENNESLEALQILYNAKGHLTAREIERSEITRSGKFYRNRFGSLANACDLAKVPYNI